MEGKMESKSQLLLMSLVNMFMGGTRSRFRGCFVTEWLDGQGKTDSDVQKSGQGTSQKRPDAGQQDNKVGSIMRIHGGVGAASSSADNASSATTGAVGRGKAGDERTDGAAQRVKKEANAGVVERLPSLAKADGWERSWTVRRAQRSTGSK